MHNEQLAGFRRAQQLSYACATQIAATLQVGCTEKEVADRMDAWLRDRGVSNFFHRSLAWFGEDARFDRGMNWQALPSKTRRLKAGEIFILDTAPLVDGYVGDIGYTAALGENEELERARSFLLELRAELPALFSSSLTTREIWRVVDQRIRARGYDNIHKKYPFSVLGHRVHRVPLQSVSSAVLPAILTPFTLHTYASFLARGILPELLGPSHRGSKTGFWAIEPHLGGPGFGAKFEEILVVEKDRAYWLDDDVPHVRMHKRRDQREIFS